MSSSSSVLFVCVFTLLVSSAQQELLKDNQPKSRTVRQLGLGSVLRPSGGGSRNAPFCQGAGGVRGKCLPMEQCVLQELNENYVRNQEYFCKLGRQGPVGVCCPDSIAKPTVYRQGMFGTKNIMFGRAEGEDEEDTPTTPASDVETI